MIFTHIFRYLDDRDAAEELRRSDNPNSSSPAINSRFPEASWEQRDFRFKKISLNTTAAPNTSGIHAPQGFCSLRAKPRPSPEQRLLPPIRASKISGGEKQLRVTEQNLTKLPPIERFACNQQSVAREVKSRSKKNKESNLKRGSGVQTSTLTNQPWLFLCPLRDGEVREFCNCDGRVLTAGTATDNLSDHFLSDENESPAHAEKAQTHQTGSSHDKFDTKAVTRKFYHKGLQQRTKQEVFGSGDVHESTQIEAITDRKEGNSTVRGQLIEKMWAARQEQSANTNEEETEHFHPSSSFGERKGFSFSEARSKEYGKVSCSRCNATNAECLHFAESNENLNARLTIGKKEANMEFNDCERRNAICEVIEKTAAPEYGLCLYEMRQNLIHFLEDQSGFLKRNTRSNKNSTLWRLCRI